jgi:hypothetical protein
VPTLRLRGLARIVAALGTPAATQAERGDEQGETALSLRYGHVIGYPRADSMFDLR